MPPDRWSLIVSHSANVPAICFRPVPHFCQIFLKTLNQFVRPLSESGHFLFLFASRSLRSFLIKIKAKGSPLNRPNSSQICKNCCILPLHFWRPPPPRHQYFCRPLPSLLLLLLACCAIAPYRSAPPQAEGGGARIPPSPPPSPLLLPLSKAPSPSQHLPRGAPHFGYGPGRWERRHPPISSYFLPPSKNCPSPFLTPSPLFCPQFVIHHHLFP